jgi:hypothetical protein
MGRTWRLTAGLCVSAIAVLAGCSATIGEPSAGVDPPGEGDAPPFVAITVNVQNVTDTEVSIVAIDGRRRRNLGTVRPMGVGEFQARLGFDNNVRFEIALRGGGGCGSDRLSGVGMLQSVNLTIQPNLVTAPGEPKRCIIVMTVV